MAFLKNPARDDAGFGNPMDVRGGDPEHVEGSLGTHVPQWAWPEGKEEPQGEELEKQVESWMAGKRDEAAQRMRLLNEPEKRQTVGNDSRPVGARRSHLGDTRVDPSLQPGQRSDERWHLVRVDGVIVAKSVTFRIVAIIEPPRAPGQANQGRVTEPVGFGRRKVELIGLTGVAADPTALRKGYASAAVSAALEYAKGEVEVGRAQLMLFQTGECVFQVS